MGTQTKAQRKKTLTETQKKHVEKGVELAKLNRQRGKRIQKKVAEIVNGLDIGILGKADILTEKFIIETKDKAKFVGETWLQQVEKHLNKREFKGKKAMAIVHIRGKRYENSIVLIRLKDFLELLNETLSGVSKTSDK